MVENLNKLTEAELAYALSILASIGEHSIDVKELSKYPEHIVDWLLRNVLLMVGEFKVEGRAPEKRATLGRRAMDFQKSWSFAYKMGIMKSINEG